VFPGFSQRLRAKLGNIMPVTRFSSRLTYRYSGRDFRLTDVAGNVVRDILA
jgi:hypothetical protein